MFAGGADDDDGDSRLEFDDRSGDDLVLSTVDSADV